MTLNRRCQLNWQLTQIGNIQKRIAIDALNVWFIIANSCSDKRNSLPAIFLFDSPQILLSRTASITRCCWLSI